MVTLRSYRKQEFRIRYIRRISTYFSKLLLNNEKKKKQKNKTKQNIRRYWYAND